eukprot:284815196_2
MKSFQLGGVPSKSALDLLASGWTCSMSRSPKGHSLQSMSMSDEDSDSGRIASAKLRPQQPSSQPANEDGLSDVGIARIKRLVQLSLPPYADDYPWDSVRMCSRSGGSPHCCSLADVVDIFYWLKQLVAVVLGLACGVGGVTGWPGYAIAMAAFIAASTTFLRKSKIPDDVITGMSFQEGLMPGIMTFTVSQFPKPLQPVSVLDHSTYYPSGRENQ